MTGGSRRPRRNRKQSGTVRYEKPKVLLVDLDDGCLAAVRDAGFNASSGTFGKPYENKPGDGYTRVPYSARLPNCEEQEIIFLDLNVARNAAAPDEADLTLQRKVISAGTAGSVRKHCSRPHNAGQGPPNAER